MTVFFDMPVENPDSAGLAPYGPSEIELALFNHPLLREWWRADHGFSAAGWRGRKSGTMLTPFRSGVMTPVAASAAYAGRPSLLFGSGPSNGELAIAESEGLLPLPTGFTASIAGTMMTVTAADASNLRVGGRVSATGVAAGTYITAPGTGAGGVGTYSVSVSQTVASRAMVHHASWSVAFIGRPGPSDNACFWGSGNGSSGGAGTYLQMQSSGAQLLKQGGTSAGATLAAGAPVYADGPQLNISSCDSDGKMRIRVNGGAFAGVSAGIANDVDNGEFHLGGMGPVGAPFGSVDAGDVSELMIFGGGLGDAANADVRALTEAYRAEYYAA